jgi:hypothetical protein
MQAGFCHQIIPIIAPLLGRSASSYYALSSFLLNFNPDGA